MTRGGPPQEVGEVLERARRNAGVAESPSLEDSSAPPTGVGAGPLNAAGEESRGEGTPSALDSDGNKARLERPAAPRHDGSLCRSCSARILWAQLLDDAGQRQKKPDGRMKAIPVDFEPVPNGNVVLADRPGEGIVARVLRRGEAPTPGARLRVSHFATCPDAQKHRRSR